MAETLVSLETDQYISELCDHFLHIYGIFILTVTSDLSVLVMG